MGPGGFASHPRPVWGPPTCEPPRPHPRRRHSVRHRPHVSTAPSSGTQLRSAGDAGDNGATELEGARVTKDLRYPVVFDGAERMSASRMGRGFSQVGGPTPGGGDLRK